MKKLVLTRDFREGYMYLEKGTIVFLEPRDVWDLITPEYVAVRLSDNPNTKCYNPYFEVPKDAVKEYYGPAPSIN